MHDTPVAEELSSDRPPALPIELIEHLNRGDCVLFVGDALDGDGSQSARLASALVDRGGLHAACPVSACRAGKCVQSGECAVPLARAAQLYESCMGRQALVDFVRRFVDEHYPARPTPPIHRALTTLPVRIIITTAYDDRLETALEMASRPYSSVVRDDDAPFDDPRRVQLIRLHGTTRDPKSLALTEDDRVDLFARLPVVTKILQGHFASQTLLFVGYGLSDLHFLELYRQVTEPIARLQRMSFAVQWPPDPLAAGRWRGKILLLDERPLAFVERLIESVRTQAEESRRAALLPSAPYKFLDYYTQDDAAIFFGRDLEAELLLSTVLAHRLTVFYGRSGTGKTSLLLARVGPALKDKGYRLAYARMLGNPADEVKAAVRGLAGAGQLSHQDRARCLADVIADALPPAGRLVVVLDQFEEFFLRQGEAVRRAFAQDLANCLTPQTSEVSENLRGLDLRFVLSLRDDYWGLLDELSAVLPGDVFAHRFKLENLSRDKTLLAILKPAEAFGLPVEEALRDQLIADLEDQGFEPASLQIVLYSLYQDALVQGLWSEADRRGAGLTLARYREMNGTQAILASYLDRVLDEIPAAADQEAARAILKSMVTAERTKTAVSGREISRGDLVARLGLTEGQPDRLLAYLRDKRVVRRLAEEDRYELAHEVMVDRVCAWFGNEELHILDVRDMLRRAMSDYQKFRSLLTHERLEFVISCWDALALEPAELEFLFRSALATRHELSHWRGWVPAVVGQIEDELLDSLSADIPAEAERAVASLVALASPALVLKLADRVEADWPDAPVTWINHLGEQLEAHRTALNLVTPCQRRAVLALSRMELPEATEALDKWTPPGMVLVSAGPFMMGSSKRSDEQPEHEVWVGAFWIDRYPITNAQWVHFIEQRGYQHAEFWTGAGWAWKEEDSWRGPVLGARRSHLSNHPVQEICWYEAVAYARYAQKSLPSEAQWEKAARGTDRRAYPWGDEFDPKKCNFRESGLDCTVPVDQDMYNNCSPYGVVQMAGNVWEWCRNMAIPYPYNSSDGRENLEGTGQRVLRGGGYGAEALQLRTAYRHLVRNSPNTAIYDYGVRLCLFTSCT